MLGLQRRVNKVDASLPLEEFKQKSDLCLGQEISINGAPLNPCRGKPLKEMEEEVS